MNRQYGFQSTRTVWRLFNFEVAENGGTRWKIAREFLERDDAVAYVQMCRSQGHGYLNWAVQEYRSFSGPLVTV